MIFNVFENYGMFLHLNTTALKWWCPGSFTQTRHVEGATDDFRRHGGQGPRGIGGLEGLSLKPLSSPTALEHQPDEPLKSLIFLASGSRNIMKYNNSQFALSSSLSVWNTSVRSCRLWGWKKLCQAHVDDHRLRRLDRAQPEGVFQPLKGGVKKCMKHTYIYILQYINQLNILPNEFRTV